MPTLCRRAVPARRSAMRDGRNVPNAVPANDRLGFVCPGRLTAVANEDPPDQQEPPTIPQTKHRRSSRPYDPHLLPIDPGRNVCGRTSAPSRDQNLSEDADQILHRSLKTVRENKPSQSLEENESSVEGCYQRTIAGFVWNKCPRCSRTARKTSKNGCYVLVQTLLTRIPDWAMEHNVNDWDEDDQKSPHDEFVYVVDNDKKPAYLSRKYQKILSRNLGPNQSTFIEIFHCSFLPE